MEVEMKKIELTALVSMGDRQKPFPVAARQMHEVLGSKTRYDLWLVRRTEKGILDHDYSWLIRGEHSGNELVNECYLSIDFAMHVALMEDTETGKKVRQHFIDIKKEFDRKNSVPISHRPAVSVQRPAVQPNKTHVPSTIPLPSCCGGTMQVNKLKPSELYCPKCNSRKERAA